MEYTNIRDPIHGQITLTKIERKIIDTAQFQRKLNLNQLGMAYLVYPGAHHTRFEHSLGTLYLTDKMAQAIGLEKEKREILRLSALCHDIGHMPLSHDSEEVLRKEIGDHELNSEKIITSGEFSDIIKTIEKPSKIAKWAQGEEYGQLISSDIGSDRIDYLLRDAHYTGVAYGVIDWSRVLATIRWNNNVPVIEKSGLESAESIILARFSMFHTVYYHHTVRIARVMFQNTLKRAIRENKLKADEVIKLNDGQLIDKLKKEYKLAEQLYKRRLLKRAYVINWQELDEPAKSFVKSGKMQEELEEKFEDVFVNPPADFNSDATISILLENKKTKPLAEISAISSSLQAASIQRSSLLICSKKEDVKKIGGYCHNLIGQKNRQKLLKPFIA